MSVPFEISDSESKQTYELLFNLSDQRSWLRRLKISQFWLEKFTIWIEIIQLFALVYAANYEEWPNEWRGTVEYFFVSLIAGDWATFYYDDVAEDSLMRSLYSLIYMLIAAAVVIVYFVIRVTMHRTILWKLKLDRVFLRLTRILYIPVALATLPYAICQYDDCWDSLFPQIIVSVLGIAIFVVYMIGMPIWCLFRINRVLVSSDDKLHEQFIQLKELEFILQLNSVWLTQGYYLFSSYKRSVFRVFHRQIFQLTASILIIIHGLFNQDIATKMLIMSIIILFFSVYITLLPPFRCYSTSWVYIIGWWTLSFNCVMGYFKAGGYDSSNLVDRNLKQILTAVNGGAVVLAVLLMIMYLLFCLKWPVNIGTIKELALGYRYVLADIRNAQRMILNLQALPHLQFVRPIAIKNMIALLKKHFRLLNREQHQLQYTVLEQMDTLDFFFHQAMDQSLFVKGKKYNVMNPCLQLEQDYKLVIDVINKRWQDLILIPKRKRRILLKLYMLRMFIGDRITRKFDQPVEYGSDLDSSQIPNIWNSPRRSETGETVFNDQNINVLIRKTEQAIESGEGIEEILEIWRKIGMDKMPNRLRQDLSI